MEYQIKENFNKNLNLVLSTRILGYQGPKKYQNLAKIVKIRDEYQGKGNLNPTLNVVFILNIFNVKGIKSQKLKSTF